MNDPFDDLRIQIAIMQAVMENIIDHTVSYCFIATSCFMLTVIPLALAICLIILRWIG